MHRLGLNSLRRLSSGPRQSRSNQINLRIYKNLPKSTQIQNVRNIKYRVQNTEYRICRTYKIIEFAKYAKYAKYAEYTEYTEYTERKKSYGILAPPNPQQANRDKHTSTESTKTLSSFSSCERMDSTYDITCWGCSPSYQWIITDRRDSWLAQPLLCGRNTQLLNPAI